MHDFQSSYILLDGAMGTELQKRILPPVRIPEEYANCAFDTLAAIHKSYAQAGSDIVYANTFGACPRRLEPLGLNPEEMIGRAIQAARKGVEGTDCKVALDLGPLGALLEPAGPLSFEEAYENFAVMVKAGVKAGADLAVIETMTDLNEVKAALLAVKENSSLPVFVTMTFEENGRTFTGVSLESMVCLLESLKADAIGINCSLGPGQLAPLLEKLCSLTKLPVIAKPNAGLPDPASGKYAMEAEDFVQSCRDFLDAGVTIAGGCCGTTPEFIRALHEELEQRKEKPIPIKSGSMPSSLCTPTQVVSLDGVRVVGERINPTGKKRMQQALLEEDLDYIARLAIEQQDAGADILDVNVGHPGVDEVKMLPRVIRRIQSVCDLPLLLDSSSPEALEAGLRAVSGRAAINSVNGKKESMEAIFPIAAKYGVPVVALCLDEKGIPETVEERLAIARRIKDKAAEYGIPAEDLWFDCLTLTVSAQPEQAERTLAAISVIAKEWKCATILGLSNISFGLPERVLVNRTFLAAALQAGLRFAILNPSSKDLMDTIAAWKVLSMEDPGCKAYTERYGNKQEKAEAGTAKVSASKTWSLQEAVIRGLEKEAADAAEKMLAEGIKDELAIAEEELIPALDQTGAAYEKGTLYLPGLLQSAAAAQAVFEVLRNSMAKRGASQASKGTIVLATVQGDVHDIGKNIVKTLLENYAFTIIDLGKDVAPEKILETVKEKDIRLVGLSALMTTTLPSMHKIIELLQTLENPPKIMVGGAVVTKKAAEDMGADFYAKDARASVSYAREVFE